MLFIFIYHILKIDLFITLWLVTEHEWEKIQTSFESNKI